MFQEFINNAILHRLIWGDTMSDRKKNSENEPEAFRYDPTPMMRHFPGNSESCFDQVNQYGTYEVQKTADTENFFPAIAQGLPKNADFAIRTKSMDDLEKE